MSKKQNEKVVKTDIDNLNFLIHDMRQPLSNIAASSECLKKIFNKMIKFLPQDMKNVGSINRMFKLLKSETNKIDEMLVHYMEEQKGKSLEISEHNLKEILLDFVETYQNSYSFGLRTYELHYDIQDEVFNFDKEKISRVLENLLSNATKFTENGMIILYVTKNDKFISITVKDSGIGIDKEDLPHIFDLGFKGKNHEKSSYGIGLFNVKQIVEMHKGSVEVSSCKGRGSYFRINISLEL